MLDLPETHRLRAVFLAHGIRSLTDFSQVSRDDIDLWSTDVIDGISLHAHDKADVVKLKRFIFYHTSMVQKGGPVDWVNIVTLDEFEVFSQAPEVYEREVETTPVYQFTAPKIPVAPISTSDFQRSVKRDLSRFPTFKSGTEFDTFRGAFANVTRIQGVYEVLIPGYEPKPTAQAKDLFVFKREYAYTAMIGCLLTDEGKSVVRKYGESRDATAVWKEFTEY